MNTTPANGGIAADLAGDLFAATQEIERLKDALSSQSQAAEGMAKSVEELFQCVRTASCWRTTEHWSVSDFREHARAAHLAECSARNVRLAKRSA